MSCCKNKKSKFFKNNNTFYSKYLKFIKKSKESCLNMFYSSLNILSPNPEDNLNLIIGINSQYNHINFELYLFHHSNGNSRMCYEIENLKLGIPTIQIVALVINNSNHITTLPGLLSYCESKQKTFLEIFEKDSNVILKSDSSYIIKISTYYSSHKLFPTSNNIVKLSENSLENFESNIEQYTQEAEDSDDNKFEFPPIPCRHPCPTILDN